MDRGRRSCRLRERGYSLLEMLVVLAIVGMMVLVSVPNLLRWHEVYLLKADSRGYANALKLGRMKAVASNFSFVSELDSATLRTQCPGQTGVVRPAIVVVYQDGTTRVEECFPGNKGLAAAAIAPSTPKITFRPNGMAVAGASPNRIKVTSRNKKFCQMVCVNTAGAVQLSPVFEGATCNALPADCSVP